MSDNDKVILAEMDSRYIAMKNCTSTSGRRYQFDKMCELMEKYPIVQQFWTLCVNVKKLVDRFIRKVAEVKETVTFSATKFDRIDWNGFETLEDGTEQFYMVELLDENKNLIWTKIGTTVNAEQRFKEHLSYKTYKEHGVKYLKVRRLWDCAECKATLFEDLFRTRLKKMYPGQFIPKDRFTVSDINYNEIDNVFSQLMNLAIG